MKNLLPGWYVIYTKPRNEKKIAKKLLDQDFKVYMPLVKTVSQWSDRKKTIDKPLFNSYLFIFLECGKDYFNALCVDGVVFFIKIGNKPVRVLNEEIDKIKLFLNEFSEVEIKNTSDLKVGQRKKIVSGPFTNYECEILKIDNKRKVCVRIDSLQQSLLAEIQSYHFL